ncbi:MAG: DUF1345 domain-containing protein [Alphaproteobacteria bacterium]|nr:DUF1345 domain-containing protein [Alphaproteobacteria bacterium]
MHAHHHSRFVRFLIARRRLLSAVVAGIVVYLLLPASLREVTRVLIAWDLTAAIYVGFFFWMVSHSTVDTCHRRAALYDESDWALLTVIVLSAAASFGAIFSELAVLKSAHQTPWLSLIVTAGTVMLSWTFTHTLFTLHYANIYYQRHADGVAGGLEFPGNRQPDYRDFVYYAFVIGCAAQTGDINTTSTEMRKVSLVHGIVAFVFNTAILALSINVGASLLS